MGEEFHKKRVQTSCCLICGPTTGPVRSIINSKKLSQALHMFIDSDLSDPNLPPNCCEKCRKKYMAYFEKHRRNFPKASPEEKEKHRSELQKRNVYPIFPYSPHTEENCKVCEPDLSIEDTANEVGKSGQFHNIPPSYSHPTRNRNEPERLGDWKMTENKRPYTFIRRDPLETPKQQQAELTPTETQTVTMSQKDPLKTSNQPQTKLIPTQTKTVTNFILPTKTYVKKPSGVSIVNSTPKNLTVLKYIPTGEPNKALGSKIPFIVNSIGQPSTVSHNIVLKIVNKPVKIAPKLPSTGTIDLPTKRPYDPLSTTLTLPLNDPTSNPLSTAITLPSNDLDSRTILPKNPFKESNSTSNSIKNEVTSEPLDDSEEPIDPEPLDDSEHTIDPEAADEASPNEPVGELLKIVNNLPLKDQFLFVKLLVLQLNDDLLSLVRKLVNTLQQGEAFKEDVGDFLDLNIDVKEEIIQIDQAEKVNKLTNSKADKAQVEVEERFVNSNTFESDQALEALISNVMKKELVDLVRNDPRITVTQHRKNVILKYQKKYEKINPQLWKDIITLLLSNGTLDEILDSVQLVSYDQPTDISLEDLEALEISKAMKKDMVDLVKSDPTITVDQHRKNVILKYKEKYEKINPQLWKDVMTLLISNGTLDEMLDSRRREVVGYDQAPDIALEMKKEMVNLLKEDPIPTTVRQKRESVIEKYREKYQKINSWIWRDIMISLGSNATLDAMLNDIRTQLVGENVFGCSKCDQIFESSEKLRKHKRKHVDQLESQVVCDKCPKTFISKTGWRIHMKLHEEENSQEKNIQCDECPKRFHLELLFKRHKLWKHSEVVCEKCGKKCSSKQRLKRHELFKHSDPSKPRPFLCDQCPTSCFTKYALKRHKIRHLSSELKPFQCDKCEKACSNRGELNEHMACHGDIRKHQCKDCGKAFKFKSTLWKHNKINHSSVLTHECDVCFEKFPTGSCLKLHKLIHLDKSQWPFACDKCGHTSKTKKEMETHINYCYNCSLNGRRSKPRGKKGMPGPQRVECNICGKPVKGKNLANHLATHSVERPYSCQECNKFFKTKSILNEHCKRHSSSERPYSCQECNTFFKTKSGLNEHCKRQHSSEMPNSCEECSKTYTNKRALEQHVKRFHHSKPVDCEQCSKAFRSGYALKEHILRVHPYQKPYSCEECSKTFATKGFLETHVKTHVKSIHCEQCPKTFTRSCELRDHLRTHTGEKPFSCDQCTQTFALKRALKLHKDKYHIKIEEIVIELDNAYSIIN